MTKLLLFDIDGTLILTHGAGSRSMTRAFQQLFAVADAFHGVKMAGKTDPLIFREAARNHGIHLTPEKEAQFREHYFGLLEKEIRVPDPEKRTMPGIKPLLSSLLDEKELFIGLLTGNWKQGAYLKLDHFGLWSFFSLGAFSDDHAIRKELVPIARSRYEQLTQTSLSMEDIVVIGDTPLDIACAKDNGAKAIAVATGPYSAEQLCSCQPDYCFQDFSDYQKFVSLVQGL